MLVLAESEKELRFIEKKAQAHEKIGAPLKWIDSGELKSRFGALDARAALQGDDDLIVNPAKFVRGMKRVVESLGVEVYEHSRCTHIEPGHEILLCTSNGSVRAKDIVMATNAYVNPLGLHQYRVFPFYVYIIVTEPLTQAQMDEFGWPGRENIYGTKYLFCSYRPTVDNRFLFIENNAIYFHDIHKDYSHRPREYKSHHKKMVKMFPFMKGVRISHQWGGRIGITLDFLPSVGRTGKHSNIYYSMGYNGHGLALELTDHMLINRRLWGVPSASLSYAGINSYKMYFKALDLWLDIGK